MKGGLGLKNPGISARCALTGWWRVRGGCVEGVAGLDRAAGWGLGLVQQAVLDGVVGQFRIVLELHFLQHAGAVHADCFD